MTTPHSPITAPQRIKLERRKGWKLKEVSLALNGLPAAKVTRPGPWGNPYKEGITPGNYASWFDHDVRMEMKSSTPTADHPWSRHLHWIGQHVHLLRGKNLACFCRLDEPCHADVLLELANPDIAALKARSAASK